MIFQDIRDDVDNVIMNDPGAFIYAWNNVMRRVRGRRMKLPSN